MTIAGKTPSANDLAITRFLNHCNKKHYTPKQLIIKEGDPAYDLYFIISGSVTVLIEDQRGREIILAYLNEGSFFGELGLFDKDHKRTAFVRAKSKSEIAKISYKKLKSQKELFPDLLFTIASQMANRLRKTNRKVGDLVFTDVKGRVACALIDLCKEPDSRPHTNGKLVRITREELGRIAGCCREMVGRVLKDLEEDHLISVSGKSIVVVGMR